MTTPVTALHPRSAGIALIVVMIAVTVLSILAAAFAYSMKVETKLAQNANSEMELIWLGRSGVEYARYILVETRRCANYDSLNQKWAGGEGTVTDCETNGALRNVALKDYQLGNGSFSITITDLDRKANINLAADEQNPLIMQIPEPQRPLLKALQMIGVDAGDSTSIVGSIMDWIDQDNNPHIGGGAENSYYESQEPPHSSKNQPIDDLSELLLVNGIRDNPAIYWGGVATNHPPAAFQSRLRRFGSDAVPVSYNVGLVDLFTPFSSGKININTASQTTLQMIPYVDDASAAEIINLRSASLEGIPGENPAKSDQDVQNLLFGARLPREVVPLAARSCGFQSSFFEVEVDAEVAGYHRKFYAILGRVNPRDVQVLSFYWK